MKSKDFLGIHLSVLLAQYGEAVVLESLAPLLDMSSLDLQERLEDIRKIKYVRSSKGKQSPKSGPSVEALLALHPDKVDIIRRIQTRFVHRTFLPELKDVRRFLDRHGQPSPTLSKRNDGFARVARVLVQLPVSDLEAILAAPQDVSYSSLGVISDEILGRK